MPSVIFTDNLKRHIQCPAEKVDGETVKQALDQVFLKNNQLRTYVLDDQDRLRKHMVIAVDGVMVHDTEVLDKSIKADSEIIVLQALSGG